MELITTDDPLIQEGEGLQAGRDLTMELITTDDPLIQEGEGLQAGRDLNMELITTDDPLIQEEGGATGREGPKHGTHHYRPGPPAHHPGSLPHVSGPSCVCPSP